MRDRFFYDADGELLIVPQLGRCAIAHRARHPRRRAGRDLRHPARRQVPRRRAGGRRARLHLRELRAAAPAAGPGSDRHVRAGQRARLPGAGRRLRGSRGRLPRRREIRRRAVGSGDRSLAARHRRLARQLRAVQVRPRSLPVHQHGDVRPPGSVDLLRAGVADGRARDRRTSSSDASRRAGSSPSTRSGRRRSTATWPASSSG